VLQRASGLSTTEVEAIAELERLVVEADGGRLKLEWGTLRSRDGDQVEDLLWWEGDQLLGFLGLYSFGPSVEFSGMVAPAARRRGIATALLDAGLDLCREQGRSQALLVVPRPSAGGRALAARNRGVLDHSEHALVLLTEPSEGSTDPRISLRRAGPDDGVVLGRLIEVGFGHPAPDLATLLGSDDQPTLVIELDGEPVGTVRQTRQGDSAGVYGFVVDPAHQGRGIGRDVLRRVCRDLRRAGARRVGLEVEVDNDRALGLYTSIGFTGVTTEDYYALPVD
jgi:ribosomal protein S18 acetylase RimI-like enzyme